MTILEKIYLPKSFLEHATSFYDERVSESDVEYVLPKGNGEWVKIDFKDTKTFPPPCTVVLGYSKKWIDEDFEPEGIRECFMGDMPFDEQDGQEWSSCVWDNDMDDWHNDYETKPTHWMQRPLPPAL